MEQDGNWCEVKLIVCRVLFIYAVHVLVGHPELPPPPKKKKKKSVGIFEYILASMLKVYLDVFF